MTGVICASMCPIFAGLVALVLNYMCDFTRFLNNSVMTCIMYDAILVVLWQYMITCSVYCQLQNKFTWFC